MWMSLPWWGLALVLLLIGLAAMSFGFKRPMLERVHLGILGFWFAAWVGLVLYWLSSNSPDRGWSGVVAFYAMYGLVVGIGLIGLIGFIAQATFAETKARSAVLVALPLLLGAWLYITSG